MCFVTWKIHIPCDMCSPSGEIHILVICFSLPGKHRSLMMWVPQPGKHLSLPGKHISLVLCVPLPVKHISLAICVTLPRKHIFLVICVPLPAQHMCIVISFSLAGKHRFLVTWVVLPIEIKKSRWQHASYFLQVQDWLSLSSILTVDLSFEYMDIKISKKRPWRPSFLCLSTIFCRGICCGSILSLVQIFFSFVSNSLSCYYHTLPYPKTKEKKIWTKDKIEPQHIHSSKAFLKSTKHFGASVV